MEILWIISAVAVVLGLYMAWNIGANDVANAMADAVGSGSLSIKWAIIAAGVCNFAGAVLVGSHVTDTVRKGIVAPDAVASLPSVGPPEAATLFILGMGAALLGTGVWLNLATRVGLPVSTTHSIVGGIAGFGIVAAGFSAVNWAKVGQIVASWFISPIISIILAFIIFRIIIRLILGKRKPARAAVKVTPYIVFLLAFVITMATIYKGLGHLLSGRAKWLTGNVAVLISLAIAFASAIFTRLVVRRSMKNKSELPMHEQLRSVERTFAPLVIISSCSVAFSQGANDVANAIGPLAAIFDVCQSGTIHPRVAVPLWVLALGGGGIVIGLATYGYRVMRTVGTKITRITPSRGVAADIAASITILSCSRLGLPVSTTHTLVGAILGIGLARGLGGINRKVTRNIFGAWLITVPAAAVLSVVFFLLGKYFLFEQIRSAFQ